MIFKQLVKFGCFQKKLLFTPKIYAFCEFNNKFVHKINSSDVSPTQKRKSQNSISPLKQEGYAYGHHFPKEWSQGYIHKILDPGSKNIEKVSIVKTKVGQKSGKIIIKFKNEKIRENYIKKYNEDFITTQNQSHRIVILPFALKTEEKLKKSKEGFNFKNPVNISNLDFDITKEQLHKLAADYGQISFIQLSVRQSGINRGFATVYFETRNSAVEFTNFLDNFKYKERKLKAYIVEKQVKKNELQLLSPPTFTFKANEQLMRKLRIKEYVEKK